MLHLRSTISILISFLGIVLFGSGFFEVNILPNINTTPLITTLPPTTTTKPNESFEPIPIPSSYSRVVILLIDALRPDMVNSNDMPSTYKLLQTADNWAASTSTQTTTTNPPSPTPRCTFVASATTPTVTMPRIKALMSGVNPSFVDVFRNFDTVTLEQDNLIRRLHQRGDRCVLLGDDTWLKLFPKEFDLKQSDPTHSFFAQDTIEVDNNITRHLNEFLDPTGIHSNSKSWDLLVMHYLGLDHCGHMRGPNSNIMKSKQKEMDSIIHQIILSISKQDEILNTNTLFVFMSDHGMTESGNHGGASTVETDAVLALFAPSKIHIDSKPITLSKHDPKIERIIKSAFDTAPRVRQLDLVPTLATTLGIPIPIDNQGTLLSPFLQTFMNKEQYLASLYTNVHQFQQSMYNQQKGNVMSTIQNDQNDQNDKNNDKNKDNKKDFNITTTTMKDYFDQSFTKISDSSTSTIDKIQLLESYLLSFSSILDTKFSSSSSSYSSMISMYIGIALLIIGTLSLLHQLYQIVTVTEIETETETTIATTTAFSSKMESAANLPRNNNTAMYRFGPKHIDEWYILCIIPVFNILALTSSSLIENEHAVWYLTITTWYFLRLRRTFTTITTNFTHVLRLFACLLLLCILRSTTSVINFSKLNHLNEPKFISSTAVIMLPPIDNPIDMYYVLVYVALTMCIALGIMYRQHVARKNATLFMFMSSLFIFVGFICVGVRLCFKSEQLITDNETMNEWSIIIPPMCSFILILLSIFINTEQQSTKNTNTKNHINDGTNESNASNASNASNELNASNASNFSFSYLLLISVVIIVMYLHRSKRIIILLEIFVLLLSTTSILTDTTEKNNAIYLPNILIYLYLGQCFFYSLGNSHTMGTADFAGAYTGTTSFNKYRTGSLACIIVYTGPLLSYFSAISYMSHVVHHIKTIRTTTMIQNRKNGDTSYVIWICCVLFLMYRMVMLITCTLLTLLFQHHLFVWSVFAPKFIYEVGHTVVLVGFVLFVWCVYYISNLLQTRSNRIGTKKTI